MSTKEKTKEKTPVDMVFTTIVPDPRLEAIGTAAEYLSLQSQTRKALKDGDTDEMIRIATRMAEVKTLMPEGFDPRKIKDIKPDAIVIDSIVQHCPEGSNVVFLPDRGFHVLLDESADGGPYLGAIIDVMTERLPGIDPEKVEEYARYVSVESLGMEYAIKLDMALPVHLVAPSYDKGFTWSAEKGLIKGAGTRGHRNTKPTGSRYQVLDPDGSVMEEFKVCDTFAREYDIRFHNDYPGNKSGSSSPPAVSKWAIEEFGEGSKLVRISKDGNVISEWPIIVK